MSRAIRKILNDIEAFEPRNGNWLGLEALLTELWSVGVTLEAQWVLLRVFERLPSEHSGPLWSILHGLESLPGYERALFESAQRCPTEMKDIMVQRARKASLAQQGIQADAASPRRLT